VGFLPLRASPIGTKPGSMIFKKDDANE